MAGGRGGAVPNVMFAVSINGMTKAVGPSVIIRRRIEDMDIQYTAVLGQGHKKMLNRAFCKLSVKRGSE